MRKFAIVTGASTGIGFELAKICLKNEYDVLIAADEPEIEQAAATLRQGFGTVEAVQADLSGPEGVDRLYAAAKGRQVDALLANAGRGLGRAFLTRTRMPGGAWSTPTSPGPCCWCRRWGGTCGARGRGAS